MSEAGIVHAVIIMCQKCSNILRVALRIAEYDTQQGKYSDGNRIV